MADGVANIWANLTDGLGVRLPDNFQFIFYKENTSPIQTDLAGMPASQQAMAVDTKLHYVEIDFGVLQPVNQMVNLPYVSDRVVFVVDQAAPRALHRQPARRCSSGCQRSRPTTCRTTTQPH